MCLVAGAFASTAMAVEARQGSELVAETFTGATADPRVLAYGTACLTGAPRVGGDLPSGLHELGGCPSDPVGPVPPGNAAPRGYLQLTDAGNDRAGAVLFDTPIRATDGLDVTFEQWQYGTTTPQFSPADGISFFLTEGTAELDAPGAFGGSLGYAQKLPDDNEANEFIPGVNNGYLGIGLDVLGNYFGDWERRGNGCEQRSPAGTIFRVPAPGPNMVTVRGPGNGTTGYCWLDATTSNRTTQGPWPSTLPGQLHGTLTSIPADATPQQAEALLEPHKRTVRVRVSPAPNPVVTVAIDFQDGQGSQEVLEFPAPEPVPGTYKFGFAASTGAFTDVHLIRRLNVETVRPPGSLHLVKKFDGFVAPDRPGKHDPKNHKGKKHKDKKHRDKKHRDKDHDAIRYRFVVTNTGEVPINDIAIDDPLVGQVTCPTGTLQPGQSITCHGTHTVTEEEKEQGFVENTATATGSRDDDGADVTSNESTLRVEVTDD
jgi:uncharacterized repeat protein (TIGR01451 family)